jgi:hypothetical protein
MQCRSTAGLEEAMNHINRFLCERTSSERFVTLFLLALNPKGEGRFINAGHNTPISTVLAQGNRRAAFWRLILGAFDLRPTNLSL